MNHKEIRRLMREHDLLPKIRRQSIATTDSDHDGPIFPELGEGHHTEWFQPALGQRHHLCLLAGRFIYVAIILDAWSRLIVGYAIGRSMDARLTLAVLKAAIKA
ncbi:hypothetical protein [Nitrobacter sp.]|uniref:hypothetical protein n=1 Tax=Nitrobacter sp. TaxID=29420 RepID=UPI00399D6C11